MHTQRTNKQWNESITKISIRLIACRKTSLKKVCTITYVMFGELHSAKLTQMLSILLSLSKRKPVYNKNKNACIMNHRDLNSNYSDMVNFFIDYTTFKHVSIFHSFRSMYGKQNIRIKQKLHQKTFFFVSNYCISVH